eukprot:3575591-Prymnesium_polylepis.1
MRRARTQQSDESTLHDVSTLHDASTSEMRAQVRGVCAGGASVCDHSLCGGGTCGLGRGRRAAGARTVVVEGEDEREGGERLLAAREVGDHLPRLLGGAHRELPQRRRQGAMGDVACVWATWRGVAAWRGHGRGGHERGRRGH